MSRYRCEVVCVNLSQCLDCRDYIITKKNMMSHWELCDLCCIACIRLYTYIYKNWERERVYLCILQINYHVQGRYQQTNANVSGKKSWLIQLISWTTENKEMEKKEKDNAKKKCKTSPTWKSSVIGPIQCHLSAVKWGRDQIHPISQFYPIPSVSPYKIL